VTPPFPYDDERERSKPFGQALKKVRRDLRLGERRRFRKLSDTWDGLVGNAIAARTRITAYSQGKLVIEVSSSVLLHELSAYMKSDILRALQGESCARDIVEIRFRLGSKTPQKDSRTTDE
jgi:hypothetical protein